MLAEATYMELSSGYALCARPTPVEIINSANPVTRIIYEIFYSSPWIVDWHVCAQRASDFTLANVVA